MRITGQQVRFTGRQSRLDSMEVDGVSLQSTQLLLILDMGLNCSTANLSSLLASLNEAHAPTHALHEAAHPNLEPETRLSRGHLKRHFHRRI